ncbi:hypothetical protein [Neobacillus notoginsengisoli]|uniref:hypothetical protein n=1 Tax=Neobacillus notoginsengisoli TaxID=1578198 RepID=UPI0013142796|nr:hypothetical protein [Neobacillus notoginsengisoli]
MFILITLIGAKGTDSGGMKRQGGDPAGALSAEEAPLTPRGKSVPEAEINSQMNNSG